MITKIKRAEELYRRQLYGNGGTLFAEITGDMANLEQFPEYLDKQAFQNTYLRIAVSVDSEDYVLLSDSLDSFIYEVLLPIQQTVFADLREYLSDIYDSVTGLGNGLIHLEETAMGYPTLLYQSNKDKYLCSTEDPMLEAYFLAKESFAPEVDSYHIWGIGLGYHIYALYEITHGSTDIYIYDTDSFLIDIARSGKLGPWQDVFKDPRIHFIADPNLTKFSESITSDKIKIILHMPSVHKLPEDTLSQSERKAVLKKLQITINSFKEQKDDIYLNFYKNIKNVDGYAEDLFTEYECQNVVIVAAGPSLDKNIHVLKEALDNHVRIRVLCVGTVLKKLINYGITPDAVFEMDALKSTYAHIEGIENSLVPLIISSTAYYELAQRYQGKKYIAFQNGFKPTEKMGHILFNTSGSVTTLALDYAIQAKAKRIIMIGCDMAFTNNCSHAKETVRYHSTKEEIVIPVKAYYGGIVNSSFLLSMYRGWIENRIQAEDANNIAFINATEGGAYIEGMDNLPLTEAIKL